MAVEFDVAAIGAGVVGCAIAERLTRIPGRSVIVIERHADVGFEASSRNSGVIHTGIHLPSKSLKATFARAGAKLAPAWCEAHGIPIRRCGMHVVVAPGDPAHLVGELLGFVTLVRRARRGSRSRSGHPAGCVQS